MSPGHRVVIVGGGFGGLAAAHALRRVLVDITLLDRRNFHLFQPLLYQVATGALSPANIASPLRGILKRQRNARVLLTEVTGFDVQNRRVQHSHGEVPYETLVIAAGATHNYFGHDGWAAAAPGLKTIEDATEIRRRILGAFEAAELEPDPDRVKPWLTFVVIGAGPTGLELAGALAEIARDTLRRDFRRIDPRAARMILIDAAPRILPTYPEDLANKALHYLRRLGVEVRPGQMVADIDKDGVTLTTRSGQERIESKSVLWAAGVQASPLGATLARAAGVELDRAGRVLVTEHLSVPGHPEIFVIGDLAHAKDEAGRPLPGVAPVAMQEGRYVARLIEARLAGRTIVSFRYRDHGTMATIGRAAAVAHLGKLQLAGLPAWLLWLFVHLMYIVEFQNRVQVFLQWAWNYFTFNRSARLITGEALPESARQRITAGPDRSGSTPSAPAG